MSGRSKFRIHIIRIIFISLSLFSFVGCGNQQPQNDEKEYLQPAEETEDTGESAKDAYVDFTALKEKNPEIFAWIYIPDTEVDCPVPQSMQDDDFYINHNVDQEEDPDGAVYIELANLSSMCDFNTVLHGSSETDGKSPFADLEKFRDPDFFAEHSSVYIYLDGNVVTYTIFAAYERENTSLLRSHDFTYLAGCQEFLDNLYGIRNLHMNLREGWDSVSPYHFLITLTTREKENEDNQFVVVAVLTQDAAGIISRVVTE